MKYQKQYVRSIEGISRLIEIFNKSILKFLDDLIDSRFLFDRSKGTSNQLKGILDRSKNWRNSSQIFGWLDWFSIPIRSIERNIWSIKGNSRSVKTHGIEFFQIFLITIFYISLEQNIVPWSYQNEIEIKTEFHWYDSLKVQYGMVKIKLKQHHDINISFVKQ